MIAEKIEKEIQVGVIQTDPRNPELLTYSEFTGLLGLLGYLNNNRYDNNKDNEELCHRIWRAMHLNECISIRNLRFLLCGVYNLYQPEWMKCPIEVEKE